MLAARSMTEDAARRNLLAEAEQALDEALKVSKQADFATYQLRVRFRAAFFGPAEVREELKRAEASNLTEPTRSLFVGSAYLQLQSPQEAWAPLNRALASAPQNPDVYLALADYHAAVQDDAKSIEMLEKAFSLNKTRADIRNRLALAVALRDGADISWQRLEQLLGSETTSLQNKLLHALLLINRGNQERQEQAARMLREMIRRNEAGMDDAVRLLAALERRRWATSKSDPKSTEAERAFNEAKRLYLSLERRANPNPLDVYRYADFLIVAGQLDEIESLAKVLDKLPNGSTLALDLRLRLAQKTGRTKDAIELTEHGPIKLWMPMACLKKLLGKPLALPSLDSGFTIKHSLGLSEPINRIQTSINSM